MSTLLDELDALVADGRLGHAYLCVGDPLLDGKAFAEELTLRVLGQDKGGVDDTLRHRVEDRLHPDVTWVEPRGKLRQIKVEDMQKALQRIQEKSFEGGWKVVVFLGADRLNPASGNKLLKNLEEPPDRTLILLVSASPERILPTLVSRCQTLRLPALTRRRPAWGNSLEAILRQGPPLTLRARLERAAVFRDFFEEAAILHLEADPLPEGESVEEDVENARISEARRAVQQGVLAAVEQWYRDVAVLQSEGSTDTLFYPESEGDLRRQAEALPAHAIEKLIANTRAAARKMEGNLPVQIVMEQTIF